MFDSYQLGLIAYAAQADELLSAHRGLDPPLLWAASFTSRVITALTEDDDELRDRAFPDWDADLDEPDVDTIRDGILECITDDILCAMPEGYETGIDAATGAPTLTWVGRRAGG